MRKSDFDVSVEASELGDASKGELSELREWRWYSATSRRIGFKWQRLNLRLFEQESFARYELARYAAEVENL